MTIRFEHDAEKEKNQIILVINWVFIRETELDVTDLSIELNQ